MDNNYKKMVRQELNQYNVHLVHRIIKTDNYYMRAYQKCLRYAEYYHRHLDTVGGVKRACVYALYAFWRRRLSTFQVKTGFQIGLHTCDWGLKFQHIGPIIINSQAKIGKNFRVYPQTLIGMAGVGNIPQIGDNVHLCCGARVIGKVRVGNNVVIAPNSLIIKDVPDNAVMVSSPATLLKYNKEIQ